MEEAVSQGGELAVSIFTAIFVFFSVMLLLGGTDAGIIRDYLTGILESAC